MEDKTEDVFYKLAYKMDRNDVNGSAYVSICVFFPVIYMLDEGSYPYPETGLLYCYRTVRHCLVTALLRHSEDLYVLKGVGKNPREVQAIGGFGRDKIKAFWKDQSTGTYPNSGFDLAVVDPVKSIGVTEFKYTDVVGTVRDLSKFNGHYNTALNYVLGRINIPFDAPLISENIKVGV
jgi:hypothetical protein